VPNPTIDGLSPPHATTFHADCSSAIQKTVMSTSTIRVNSGSLSIYDRNRVGLNMGRWKELEEVDAPGAIAAGGGSGSAALRYVKVRTSCVLLFDWQMVQKTSFTMSTAACLRSVSCCLASKFPC
jgi:hypothetical protein